MEKIKKVLGLPADFKSDSFWSVTMYRWGDNEAHSYQLGIYSSFEKAIKGARTAEVYRGGKYYATFYKCRLDGEVIIVYRNLLEELGHMVKKITGER